MSTPTNKLIDDIKKQIEDLDQQLLKMERIKEERNRLRKILNLMNKTSTPIQKTARVPTGLTSMVYEVLTNGQEFSCQEILVVLTESKGVPLSINLTDSIRGAVHRLKTAQKIFSPRHGIWKIISTSTSEQKDDGPPSINEILGTPKLMGTR